MDNNIKNVSKFNEGYTLAKLDNDLALKSISRIDDNSSENLQFFREGVIEFEKEKLYSRLINNQKDNQKNLGIDK